MKKWYYFVVVGIVATLMSGCHQFLEAEPEKEYSVSATHQRLVIILSGSGQPQAVEFVQDKTLFPPSWQYRFGTGSRPWWPDHFQKLTSIKSLSLLVNSYNIFNAYKGESRRSYSYGLGTVENKGSENIYILTATPKEALRLQEAFANLPAGNDLWSSNWLWPPRSKISYAGRGGNSRFGGFSDKLQSSRQESIALVEAELEKLRDSLARKPDLVTEIVTKYREAHRPLQDENGQPYASGVALPLEFPGLTVVAPGETKPIVSPEIAPQEYAGDWTFPL